MIDSKGEGTVKYTYDSWGKVVSITGDMAETLQQVVIFQMLSDEVWIAAAKPQEKICKNKK